MGGAALTPADRATMNWAILVRVVPRRNPASANSPGRCSALFSTSTIEPPKLAMSNSAMTSASGARTSAASSATRRAMSCSDMRHLLVSVSVPRHRWLYPFEDRGDALAASNAHSDKRILAAGPLQFVQRLHGEDGARRGERVPECDAAAVRVGPVGGQIGRAHV